MCVGFRCRARIIIPLFFLFPDGRGLNKGKSFLVAAFVVHADFIQVHAFVFVLLGESDFDFIAPYFIKAVHFYFHVLRCHENLMPNSVFEVVYAVAAEAFGVVYE